MKNIILAALLALLTSSITYAHNKVVVIPMSGDDLKPLKNIITVAKQNGDYDDPVAAVNAINDAAEDNPYLVVIAPGKYTLDEPLTMKRWVSVSGSGRKATYIEANVGAFEFDDTAAMLKCASDAALTDMTLSNISTHGTHAIGISCSRDNTILERLSIVVSGIIEAYGIFVSEGEPYINNTDIEVSGRFSYGIYNFTDIARIENITIDVSGTRRAEGITNDAASPKIHHASIKASSDQDAFGVYNKNGSIVKMLDIIVSGEGGSDGYGVHNLDSSSIIRGSQLSGSSIGIRVFSADTRVSDTQIDGGVSNHPPNNQCHNTYDKDFNDVSC